MNNPQLTADEIKKLAKQKNVSISKLLLDCGLNKNALYTMQNSGYYPRVEALIKIADYLECSVDYLLGRNYKPIDTSRYDVAVFIGRYDTINTKLCKKWQLTLKDT